MISWLNLHLHIPMRALRREFYCRYLTALDRLMVMAAHGCCPRREGLRERHLVWAIKEDRFRVFCWIFERRIDVPIHRWVITSAFEFCRLDVLDYLKRRGVIVGGRELYEGVYTAAFRGDTRALQWLVDSGIEPDVWCCSVGAMHGRRMEVLKWAMDQRLWPSQKEEEVRKRARTRK